mmetsp:Transcript_5256/g.23638  ORF Transcript_5256/g.23638 Transcript_5256/m.23638 type:complete len:204 (-) Transcript_5256:773-1384(-)
MSSEWGCSARWPRFAATTTRTPRTTTTRTPPTRTPPTRRRRMRRSRPSPSPPRRSGPRMATACPSWCPWRSTPTAPARCRSSSRRSAPQSKSRSPPRRSSPASSPSSRISTATTSSSGASSAWAPRITSSSTTPHDGAAWRLRRTGTVAASCRGASTTRLTASAERWCRRLPRRRSCCRRIPLATTWFSTSWTWPCPGPTARL